MRNLEKLFMLYLIFLSCDVLAGNKAPKAIDKFYIIPEDQPKSFNLSAQDELIRKRLKFTILSQPKNGTLKIELYSHQITYTPNKDFNGSDSFTFNATDPAGLISNTGTISFIIKPVNDKPIAEPATFNFLKLDSMKGNLIAKDIDGDKLLFVIKEQTKNGYISLNPLTGEFTYIMGEQFSPIDEFQFLVKDGKKSSEIKKVKINIKKNPLITSNEIQNLFLGVSQINPFQFQEMHIKIDTSLLSHPKIVHTDSWKAEFISNNGSVYPLNIVGPRFISSEKLSGIKIKSYGCENKGPCPEYPDVDVLNGETGFLKLSYSIVNSINIATTMKPIILPIRIFSNRGHQSIYTHSINAQNSELNVPKGTEFDLFEFRFSLRELSMTFFAIFNFAGKGGYAGVSHNETIKAFGLKLSIWNNCKDTDEDPRNDCLRDGQNYRTQFVEIGDGFQTFRKPEGDFLDNNFSRLQKNDFTFIPGNEYSMRLLVKNSSEKFNSFEPQGTTPETFKEVVNNPNNDEDWTFYSLTLIDHANSNKEYYFGTLARFGANNFTKMSSFMEAIGQTKDYQKRGFELISAKARVKGETLMRMANIAEITSNLHQIKRYPAAVYVTESGRLRIESGGNTTQP